jgi:ABC-type transport system involved in multi-copper enzyme maturation permease subunit
VLTFSATIARITLLEALRSRMNWVAIVAMGVAFGVAQFLSLVAMIEVAQIQIALMAALLRAIGAFLIAAFCITSMARESNDKITELFLSQPAPRAEYYLGKISGYAGVAIILAAVFAIPLAVYCPFAKAAIWGVSLACELLLVAAISVFCAISLTHVTAAFAATVGFYLLARSISAMQIIAATPINLEPSWTDDVLRWIIDAIAMVMPNLDRMTLTTWLVDQPPSSTELSDVLLQTLVYLVLIGSATMVDLYRKNF